MHPSQSLKHGQVPWVQPIVCFDIGRQPRPSCYLPNPGCLLALTLTFALVLLCRGLRKGRRDESTGSWIYPGTPADKGDQDLGITSMSEDTGPKDTINHTDFAFTVFLGQADTPRGPDGRREFQGNRAGCYCCSFLKGRKCCCHLATRQGPALPLEESCISGPFTKAATTATLWRSSFAPKILLAWLDSCP